MVLRSTKDRPEYWENLERENNELRAENERLRSWSKAAQEAFERGHRLEDEVERYQALLRETLEIWHDEEGKMRIENERLRAALLKIEEIVTRPDMASDHTFVVTAVYNLAIEALGRDKDG